jgi:predicted nucleic acid-binding protein
MIVLDTNVISEVLKRSLSPAVASWMAHENLSDLFTTAVTEAEILLGIAILPDGRRKREIEAAAQRIMALFASRILPFESMAAQSFSRILADRRRIGLPINNFDAQIAAIAHSCGMALATRNAADFEGTGINVIDPWGS